MELQMCGQCSQRVCEGLLAAWVAQPSAASPKNRSGKSRLQIPLRRLYRKVIRNDGFRACRGL